MERQNQYIVFIAPNGAITRSKREWSDIHLLSLHLDTFRADIAPQNRQSDTAALRWCDWRAAKAAPNEESRPTLASLSEVAQGGGITTEITEPEE